MVPRTADASHTGQALLVKLEGDLEALESHLVDLNRYSERLTSEYNEKVELQEVLLKTQGLFAAEVSIERINRTNAVQLRCDGIRIAQV